MSMLPEMHLIPTDFQSIIELVRVYDTEIAEKLDESYHSASFNVTENAGPVCFISHAITDEEAVKVLDWLLHKETTAYTADEVKYFGRLVEQWRPVSGKYL